MRGGRPESSSDAQDQLGSDDSFERAHGELLEDRSIQFELPPVERDDSPPPFELDPDMFGKGDMGLLPQLLFWIVIGLAAAGLLYLIVVRLAPWRRRERPLDAVEPDWRIAPEPARELLGEAEALAAQGRFSEAAHLLLHRSIEEIDRRRPTTVRKALTSRDIAGLPSIPPSPAEAFISIVRAVERSLFGRRDLDAGDWHECREAYRRFAFAREWQA